MSSGNPPELAKKQASLIAVVEEMFRPCEACRAQDTPVVIMHQDAFAADYQEEEYRRMGMAVKFGGTCGKEIHIIRPTRRTSTKAQSLSKH